MASELTTLVLEPMESSNLEQPYMANYEQSLHPSHAASVAGRGQGMQQFVIWAQFPWVHTLPSLTKGGRVTPMLQHDAFMQEGIIIDVQLLQLNGGVSYEPAGLLDQEGGCATQCALVLGWRRRWFRTLPFQFSPHREAERIIHPCCLPLDGGESPRGFLLRGVVGGVGCVVSFSR